jgi:N4-gp56 family major capsid protein
MATTTQTTAVTASTTTYLNKTFYDKNLLATAKARLVYSQFGQKRPIPENGGKTVEFRRWTLFTPSSTTQLLTEGVTPDGQNLGQTKVEATVAQYGAFVLTSDLLNLTAYDDVIGDTSELLGEQLYIVVDNVTRDAMISGASDQFAGGAATANAVAASSYLTIAEIRKAVRTLKTNKARMFSEGGKRPHFICIVDPSAVYDLQSDNLWQDVSKYSNAEQVYSGELGRMFGVVFVETSEGYVQKQSVLDKVSEAVTSGHSFVLAGTPSAAAVAYLSTPGKKIKVGSAEYTLDATTPYVASTKTVTVTATFSSQAALAANDIVYSDDAGAPNATTKAAPDLHHTLIFGADAYGTVEIGNSGSIELIVKPCGSSGTADPLNQRSTIGAKVMGYAAKVLNSSWIIDIQHAVNA